jgi:hypothetical protein
VALVLTADEAEKIALRDSIIRQQIPIKVRKTVRISRNSLQDRANFVAKIEELRTAVQRHGWTASGFDTSDENGDWVIGEIVPPATAQPWIKEQISIESGQAYNAIFLEHVDVDTINLVVTDDQASGTFQARFSDCTAICKLWLDVRGSNEEIGELIFPDYNSQFPLDTDQTFTVSGKLEFSWNPTRGWQVRSARK